MCSLDSKVEKYLDYTDVLSTVPATLLCGYFKCTYSMVTRHKFLATTVSFTLKKRVGVLHEA